MAESSVRSTYLRPLWLSIALATSGELVIFVVWGLVLFPEGDPLTKFLWTVVFCGVGMGSAMGALTDLVVVERLDGIEAVVTVALMWAVPLGLGCDLLCFNLDRHYFRYFGGSDAPGLFIGSGVVMAAIGGVLVGLLCFTERGRRLLDHLDGST